MLEALLGGGKITVPHPIGQIAYVDTGTDTFVVPTGIKELSVVFVGGGGGGGAGKDGGPTDSSLCRAGSPGGSGALIWINVLPVKKGDRLKFVRGAGGSGTILSGAKGGKGGDTAFYINDVLIATAGGGDGGNGGNRTGTTVPGGLAGIATIHKTIVGAKYVGMAQLAGASSTSWGGRGSQGSTLGIFEGTASYTSILRTNDWWGFGGSGGSTYTGTASSKYNPGEKGKSGGGRIIWGDGREFLNKLVYNM